MKRTSKQIEGITGNKNRPDNSNARNGRRRYKKTVLRGQFKGRDSKKADTIASENYIVQKKGACPQDERELEWTSRRASKSAGKYRYRHRGSSRPEALIQEEVKHNRNIRRRMDDFERSTDEERASSDSGDSLRLARNDSPCVIEKPLVRPSDIRGRLRDRDYTKRLSPPVVNRPSRVPRGAKYSLLDIEANYYDDLSYDNIYQSYNLSPRVSRKAVRSEGKRERYLQEFSKVDRRRRPLSGSRVQSRYHVDASSRPRRRVNEDAIVDDFEKDIVIGRYGEQLLEVDSPIERDERRTIAIPDRKSRGRKSPSNYPPAHLEKDILDDYHLEALSARTDARYPRLVKKRESRRRSLKEVGRRNTESHAGAFDFSEDDSIIDERVARRRPVRHPVYAKNLHYELIDSEGLKSGSSPPEDLLCDSENCDDLGMLDTPNLSPGCEEFCDIMYDQNLPNLKVDVKTDSMSVNLSSENIPGEFGDYVDGTNKERSRNVQRPEERESLEAKEGIVQKDGKLAEIYVSDLHRSIPRNKKSNNTARVDAKNEKNSHRKHGASNESGSKAHTQGGSFKNRGFWYHLKADEQSNLGANEVSKTRPCGSMSPAIVVEEFRDEAVQEKIEAEPENSNGDDGYYGRSIGEISNNEDAEYEAQMKNDGSTLAMQKLESGIWSESADTYNRMGENQDKRVETSQNIDKDQDARDLFLGICKSVKEKSSVTNDSSHLQGVGRKSSLTRSLSMSVNPSSGFFAGTAIPANTTELDDGRANAGHKWRMQKAYSLDWAERCCPNFNHNDLYFVPEVVSIPESKITVQRRRRYRNITISWESKAAIKMEASGVKSRKSKHERPSKDVDKESTNKRAIKTSKTKSKKQISKKEKFENAGKSDSKRSNMKSKEKVKRTDGLEFKMAATIEKKSEGSKEQDVILKLDRIGKDSRKTKEKHNPGRRRRSGQNERYMEKESRKGKENLVIKEEDEVISDEEQKKSLIGKLIQRKLEKTKLQKKSENEERMRKEQVEEEIISDEETKKALLTKLIRKKKESMKLQRQEKDMTNTMKEKEKDSDLVVSDEERKTNLISKLIRKKKEARKSNEIKQEKMKENFEDNDISDEETKTKLLSNLIRKKKEAKRREEIEKDLKFKTSNKTENGARNFHNKRNIAEKENKRNIVKSSEMKKEKDFDYKERTKRSSEISYKSKKKTAVDKTDSRQNDMHTVNKLNEKSSDKNVSEIKKCKSKNFNDDKERDTRKILRERDTLGNKITMKPMTERINRNKQRQNPGSKADTVGVADGGEIIEDLDKKKSLIGSLVRRKRETKEAARKQEQLEQERLKALENLRKPFKFSDDDIIDSEDDSSDYEDDSNDDVDEANGSDDDASSSEELMDEGLEPGSTEYETESEEEEESEEGGDSDESEEESEEKDESEYETHESEEESEEDVSEYVSDSQDEDPATSEDETDEDQDNEEITESEDEESQGEEAESEIEELTASEEATESEEVTGGEEATESEEESETDGEFNLQNKAQITIVSSDVPNAVYTLIFVINA